MLHRQTPDIIKVSIGIIILVFFGFGLKFLSRTGFKLAGIVIIGLVLIMGTNLIQGYDYGYINPITGSNPGRMMFSRFISVPFRNEFWMKVFDDFWDQATRFYDFPFIQSPLPPG